MKKVLTGIITILSVYATVIATLYLMDTDQKIGYVYSNEILKSYNKAVEADSLIAFQTKQQQQKINILQSELDSLAYIFNKNEKKWSAGKKKKFQETYLQKDKDFKEFAQTAQQEISKKQQELLKPVYAEIDSLIKEYAKEHGFKMILGAAQGNIVYAEEATNLTEWIAKYINTNSY